MKEGKIVMSEIPKISNSEWEVMKIIWNHAEITSTNIIQELKKKRVEAGHCQKSHKQIIK